MLAWLYCGLYRAAGRPEASCAMLHRETGLSALKSGKMESFAMCPCDVSVISAPSIA